MFAVPVSGACSEPRYGSDPDASASPTDAAASERAEIAGDAAMPQDEPSDAGHGTQGMDSAADASTPVAAGMPDWAAPLIGQYGLRARFFQRDRAGTPGKLEWIMLGRFAFDAASGEVTLTTQLCEAVGTSTFLPGVTTDSGPRDPQLFPRRVYKVLNDASGWSTDSAPLRIGFDAEPLVPCPTPGARVAAHFSQIWNPDGQCTCPTDANTLPEHARDCRVNDVDNDGSPAATVAFTGAVPTRFHVLQYDSSRIVRGTIDSNARHHDARYAAVQENVQLTCGDAPCVKAAVRLCDSAENPVKVSPLAPSSDGQERTCAEVLARKAELFGTDPLVFPSSGC